MKRWLSPLSVLPVALTGVILSTFFLHGSHTALRGPAPAAAYESVPQTFSGHPLIRHLPVIENTSTAGTARTFPYTYTVRDGDYLSKIAQAAYGNSAAWTVIWQANKNQLGQGTVITGGQRLTIPKWNGRSFPPGPSPPPAPSPSDSSSPAPATSTSTAPVPAPVPAGSLQSYAASIFGSQFGCANSIIMIESGYDVTATNPTSGAYGIPQALPGSKMASAGADWQTNGETQLNWMLGYVNSTYGGACNAWAHEQADGWY